MYYVYLIKSINNSDQTYVGYTSDLKDRMIIHNSGGSVHTTKYKPCELVAFIGFKSKLAAVNFELYLKSGSGRAFAAKRLW